MTKGEWYDALVDIPWDDARLFLVVSESGSLSRAAQRLGIAQPTVSRRLANLESAMGEALFVRDIAGSRLTPFGESLLQHARRMDEAAAELGRAVARRETAWSGVVRITAPPGFAVDLVVPFAASLKSELPGLHVEVISSVRYLDLGRREADLALRLVRPDQKELVVLATRALVGRPFAAPALVARLGKRPKPHDVPWIAWAPPFEETQPNPFLRRLIPDFTPAFASDDFLVQHRAAEAGLGALFLSGMPHRFSRPSALVGFEVQGIAPYQTAIHLVASKGALSIPRVRAVADRLAAVLTLAPTKKRRLRK